MPPAGRLLLAALALQAVAAFEPVSVAIAIGAASALTGYLSYKDLYCRFAECCREKQLNASGTAAGRPGGARGARGPGPYGRQDGPAEVGGGSEDGRGLGPDSRPGSRASETDSPDRAAQPTFLSKCSDSLGLQSEEDTESSVASPSEPLRPFYVDFRCAASAQNAHIWPSVFASQQGWPGE